jgi:hypothetical protein
MRAVEADVGGFPAYRRKARPQSSRGARRSRILLILGGCCAIVVAAAGTVSLWMHYAAIVFFETIRVGFAACFG